MGLRAAQGIGADYHLCGLSLLCFFVFVFLDVKRSSFPFAVSYPVPFAGLPMWLETSKIFKVFTVSVLITINPSM